MDIVWKRKGIGWRGEGVKCLHLFTQKLIDSGTNFYISTIHTLHLDVLYSDMSNVLHTVPKSTEYINVWSIILESNVPIVKIIAHSHVWHSLYWS